MLNRLASLITGRVNMATAADPRGYPVGRQIACVFHILTPASGPGLCTVETLTQACASTSRGVTTFILFYFFIMLCYGSL